MPTLVSTPAAANANTFADLDWYKEYLSTRLPEPSFLASALADEIDDQLTVDLIAGRRLLEAYIVWTGSATTTTQSLTWPRESMYDANGTLIDDMEIPARLKDAQSEAGVILRTTPNLFGDNAAKRKGVKRVKASTVEVEFQDDKSSSSVDLLQATLSLDRPEYLFQRLPSSILSLLVPSWYVRPSLTDLSDNEFDLEVY